MGAGSGAVMYECTFIFGRGLGVSNSNLHLKVLRSLYFLQPLQVGSSYH